MNYQRIQYRRDTAIRWTVVNPVLAAGEPGYELDTGKHKIGDGTTKWTDLKYAAEVGSQGQVGPAGPVGPSGPSGSQGPRGDQGPVGAMGPVNVLSVGNVTTGPSASVTITGNAPSQVLNLVLPRGEKGDTGAKGDRGDQGLQGIQGIKGDKGDTGSKGDAGPKGDTGAKGDAAGVVILGTANAWPPAASPTTGDIWIIGLPVPSGTPAGYSAGDSAVWDGTKWVNVGPIRGPQGLKGDKGDTGAKGDQGLQGVQGVQGNAGPRGDVGPQGAKGDTGSQGPVGATGPANTLSIGTVAGGTAAAVTITGNAPAQTLNFVLPKGDPGTPGKDGLPGTYISEVVRLEDGKVLAESDIGKLLWFVKKAPSPALTNNIAFGDELSDKLPVGSQVTLLHDMPESGANVSITLTGTKLSLGWEGEPTAATGQRLPVINQRYRTARLYKVSDTRWMAVGDLAYYKLYFSEEPSNVSTPEDTTVVFRANAQTSEGPILYRWQFQSPTGTTWSDLNSPSAFTNQLSVVANAAANGRKYRCVATNSLAGSATSVTATLTATPKVQPDASKWADLPSVTSIEGLTFANGMFVNSRGLYSTDGRTWTPPSEGNLLVRPAFGAGTWLSAVNRTTGSNLTTSSDGKNWVPRSAPPQSGGYYVFGYGFGRFVCFSRHPTVGQPVNIYHSTDGVTWTKATTPTGTTITQITGVATGFGGAPLMVAVGAEGSTGIMTTDQFLTSPDGINWTLRTMPASARFSDICFSGGAFLAVGHGNQSFLSGLGTVFGAVTMPATANWSGVCHDGQRFVCVADSTTLVATSTDTITWQSRYLPVSRAWTGVAFGNGAYVATSGTGSAICDLLSTNS